MRAARHALWMRDMGRNTSRLQPTGSGAKENGEKIGWYNTTRPQNKRMATRRDKSGGCCGGVPEAQMELCVEGGKNGSGKMAECAPELATDDEEACGKTKNDEVARRTIQ